MKELYLIAVPGADTAPRAPGRRIAHWQSRDVPEDEISIPRLLDDNLSAIRTEHMRWAYDMAFLPVRKGWGGKLAKMLSGGQQPSMWWTSLLYERHPKLSPYLYNVYRLRVLEMYLQKQSIEKLTLSGGDGIMEGIIARMCANLKMEFKHIRRPDSVSKSSRSLTECLYAHAPAPIRAIARLAYWFFSVRRYLPLASKKIHSWKNGKSINNTGRYPATIVTYFPNIDLNAAAHGRFRSRYWESLHQALNEVAEKENPAGPHFVRWLFIRFPSPQISLPRCVELCRTFEKEGRDGQSFTYIEEMLSFWDILTALRRWFAIGLSSFAAGVRASGACRFAGSAMDFWPYMRAQWAESFRGWRCLERCLQNRAFQVYYSASGQQRWNLFPLENCPWERMLTQAAHDNAAGPVYGAQHSIIRPTDFRYFDDPRTFSLTDKFQPDQIAGNGTSALDQWLANDIPAQRCRKVEALRYLYLVEHEEKWPAAKASDIPPEPGEPLAPQSSRRLLVLTSFFADETNAHLELLHKSLEAGFLNGWQIVIKPHPYLAVEDWLAKQTEQAQRQIRIADGPMVLELRPGVTVWASNSTTAALEAALFGLPVLVMLPHNDFDLCPIQNIHGLPRSGNIEDVRQFLQNPAPLEIPPGYLDLDPSLTSWRELLNLNG